MVADALLKEYSIVRMEFQNTHSAEPLSPMIIPASVF